MRMFDIEQCEFGTWRHLTGKWAQFWVQSTSPSWPRSNLKTGNRRFGKQSRRCASITELQAYLQTLSCKRNYSNVHVRYFPRVIWSFHVASVMTGWISNPWVLGLCCFELDQCTLGLCPWFRAFLGFADPIILIEKTHSGPSPVSRLWAPKAGFFLF